MSAMTMTTIPLETLGAADLEPHTGESFRIAAQDSTITLRLAAVRRLGQGQRAGGGFTLDFVMAEGPHLQQGIYQLTNDAMGTLEIFLVPIGPIEGGRGYEAVFT